MCLRGGGGGGLNRGFTVCQFWPRLNVSFLEKVRNLPSVFTSFCQSTQCKYYRVPYRACTVWCLILSYSKTAVFVRSHKSDHPAFSKISTRGSVFKKLRFWCRKRHLRMDRRLKLRKTKLLFQKTNILICVDGTSFHVCVLRTKRIVHLA